MTFLRSLNVVRTVSFGMLIEFSFYSQHALIVVGFRVLPWVDNLALMTAQRAMHLTYPEQTSAFGFRYNLPDPLDHDIWQTFLWTSKRDMRRGSAGTNKMLVVVQPPWILSEADIREFASSGPLVPFNMDHYMDVEPGARRGATNPDYEEFGKDAMQEDMDTDEDEDDEVPQMTSRERVWSKASHVMQNFLSSSV